MQTGTRFSVGDRIEIKENYKHSVLKSQYGTVSEIRKTNEGEEINIKMDSGEVVVFPVHLLQPIHPFDRR